MTHLAIRSDTTQHTQRVLLDLVSPPQRETLVKLLTSKDPKDNVQGRAWFGEFLSDEGARLVTCNDAVFTGRQKMDAANEQKIKTVLADLYPIYQKFSDEKKDALATEALGNKVVHTRYIESHPPAALRDAGKPLTNFCPAP